MNKFALRTSVSVFTLALAAGAAYAQDNIDTVTVTGVRASVNNALEIKKNATQILDSIVSEDIGKLPDTTVVEALQHVTGVAILRGGYEPSTVLIRGLPDNQTLLNGRQIFTATGRSVSLPDFPAELLARVDVHKASSATDISGGVAGLIDVHLHRPFDFDGFQLAGGASLTHPTLATNIDPSASLLISDRWDTSIGEIGLLLDISFKSDHNREEGINPGGRAGLSSGPVTGSTVPGYGAANQPCTSAAFTGCPNANLTSTSPIRRAPDGRFYSTRFGGSAFQRNGLVERAAVSTVAQWRPADNIEIFAEAFYTRMRNAVNSDFFVGQTANCNNSNRTTVYPGSFFNQEQYSGCFSITSNQPLNRKEDTFQAAWGGSWDVSDRLKLTTEWSATQSKDTSVNYILDVMYNMPFDGLHTINSYQGSGATYIDMASTTHLNGPDMFLNQFYDQFSDARGSAWDGRVDANYNFGPDARFLKSIELGYRFNYRTAHNEAGVNGGIGCSPTTRGTPASVNNKYLLAAYDSPACVAFRDQSTVNGVSGASVRRAGGTAAQIAATVAANHAIIGNPLGQGNSLAVGGITMGSLGANSTHLTHGSFFDGKFGLTGWATPDQTFLRQNPEIVRNAFGYSGQQDLSPAARYIVSEVNDDFYWKANYGFELFNFPVDGNFGIRYVSTALKQIANNTLYVPAVPPAGVVGAAATTFINACTTCIIYTPITARKTTHDLLPSVNVRVTLDEGLFLRFGASKTITRPTFTQTNPSQRVTAATANLPGAITAGNPNLNPIKSINLDADLAYYWGTGNHINAAVFTRDVAGYIQTQTNQVFIDGLAYNNNIPVNFQDATLNGVEAGYSQFLDFLPGFWSGFGWDVNATYIAGVFQNISNWHVNTAGIYESGPLSVRVSWTWGSKYLEGTSVGPQPNDRYVAPRANLDASINYDLTDQITVGLDATNIANSHYRSFTHFAGGDLQTNMDVFASELRRFDRTLSATVRFRY